jgi:hypothetical protein
MKTIKIMVSLVILNLQGCAWIDARKDDQAALLNPRKIHVASDSSSAAYMASQIPVSRYYEALKLAQSTYAVERNAGEERFMTGINPSAQRYVENYVNEGIGLVDSYCLRWFQRMDDMSRLLAFQNKSVNVISQLGTTLLGLGSASANWVAGYGAANTAYAGMSENFNGSFLVAPNSSKVKDHIQSAMKQEAENLRYASSTMSFIEAYNAVERYADLCTYNRAKQIVDASLELTKTGIDANTDQVKTETK